MSELALTLKAINLQACCRLLKEQGINICLKATNEKLREAINTYINEQAIALNGQKVAEEELDSFSHKGVNVVILQSDDSIAYLITEWGWESDPVFSNAKSAAAAARRYIDSEVEEDN